MASIAVDYSGSPHFERKPQQTIFTEKNNFEAGDSDSQQFHEGYIPAKDLICREKVSNTEIHNKGYLEYGYAFVAVSMAICNLCIC